MRKLPKVILEERIFDVGAELKCPITGFEKERDFLTLHCKLDDFCKEFTRYDSRGAMSHRSSIDEVVKGVVDGAEDAVAEFALGYIQKRCDKRGPGLISRDAGSECRTEEFPNVSAVDYEQSL